MAKYIRFLALFLLLSYSVAGQVKKPSTPPIERPKLVVGLVVDQMRWDYLYRYYDRYAPDGGLKRLLSKGFSCENTMINYVPSYTACGHTSLYTGTVPAIHGITGNDWWENNLRRERYCTEDETVQGVGTAGKAGQMSPRNMFVTGICDELRLATNFRSKVIGISVKDRGAILPAGHAANAAYWYEGASGNWISSTYYMKTLPAWVNDFNHKKLPDYYYRKGWNTLYPVNTYAQSAGDEQSYEGKPFGDDAKGFPYTLEKFIGNNYSAIISTPYGNTITKEMAIAAINAEDLGKDSITDFLAVSFSTPDYIGHAFGPNSIEVEDNYLRLDKDLGDLFRLLDKQVGKDQYLVFLSADHGVAHVAGFSKEHKLPGGTFPSGEVEHALDSVVRKQFGNYRFMLSFMNNQIVFDHQLIDSVKADKKAISAFVINYLSKVEGVDRVFETKDIMTEPMAEKVRTKLANGFYPSRCGDIQILLKSGWMGGSGIGTTHGAWNPYDTHIPLLWYGWKIRSGKTNREVYMTDVAPTIAAMLRIQMPSGTTGNVIQEIF